MSDPRQSVGQRGERAVAAWLRRAGYTILARNWRHRELGELDIVARQGDEIVFVEVRTRRGTLEQAMSAALESVDERKRARLIALAQAYLDAHDLAGVRWRVDVAAVAWAGDTCAIQIVPNALEW
ncbi:MAG: YraN family protein [Anaerolineae bacterium]|nr:YraN family protein [Anaerolineae bacterium]